jgi:formylglycine-generating enzyme required for sulfatase activity
LARLWFGDPAEQAQYAGGEFLAHVLTSDYRPPEGAVWLVNNPEKRGRYVMNEVATTGPARLRIPIVIWVTPHATMASAQGYGSYYDGCYWSISFASCPANAITGGYSGGRNILQRRNVMVTFGEVAWHGGLKREKEGNVTVGGDGKALVGQIDMGEDCHLLMVSDDTDYASADAFKAALAALQPRFEAGIVTWKMPDGKAIKMVNERSGARRKLVSAWEDDQPIRLDTNLLFDSPHIRSVRGSRLIEVVSAGEKRIYDFRDPERPEVRPAADAAFAKLPPDKLAGPLGTEFLYVPPGEFPMGSAAAEGRPNERPQRWVHVDGFYVSKTEVTVSQFKQYLAANPDAARLPDWYLKDWGKTDSHPVAWVRWNDATAFCRWLTKQDGQTYRLPTEAEWEKAAKGFSHRTYPWGDEYDGSQSGTPNGTYAPAGSKPTDCSPFGVLDMAGNLWEWCADWFAPAYYRDAPESNPKGPDSGEFRSLRGCGWNFDPDTFRCSYRTRLAPAERSVHIGFRIVREP